MNCGFCNRELPEHPCCTVNMHEQEHGIFNAVIVGLDSKVAADFGPNPQESVVNDCAEFARSEGCNLHFHWFRKDARHEV